MSGHDPFVWYLHEQRAKTILSSLTPPRGRGGVTSGGVLLVGWEQMLTNYGCAIVEGIKCHSLPRFIRNFRNIHAGKPIFSHFPFSATGNKLFGSIPKIAQGFAFVSQTSELWFQTAQLTISSSIYKFWTKRFSKQVWPWLDEESFTSIQTKNKRIKEEMNIIV